MRKCSLNAGYPNVLKSVPAVPRGVDMGVKNKYWVPKKQWNKWTESARVVFNQVYYNMTSQKIFIHPQTKLMDSNEWRTIRWNVAWVAADAVQNLGRLTINVKIDRKTLKKSIEDYLRDMRTGNAH